MPDLHVITTMGAGLKESVLQESTIHDFKAGLRGALLCPGDVGYEDARKVWNGMIHWTQQFSFWRKAHVTEHLQPLFPGSAGVSPAPEAAKMAALPGDSAPVTTCGGGYFPTKGPKLELLQS